MAMSKFEDICEILDSKEEKSGQTVKELVIVELCVATAAFLSVGHVAAGPIWG